MIRSLDPRSFQFLTALERTRHRMDAAQRQISSGMRVERPSDDPSVVTDLLQRRTDLQIGEQLGANLEMEKTVVDAAENVLREAVSLVERTAVLAAQGASSLTSPEQRAQIADAVAVLHERLVGISQTQTQGRYLFSGDEELNPQYSADATGTGGVVRLHTAEATRATMEPGGTTFVTGRTAQQIFDARDGADLPAAGNVFVAVWQLASELRANSDAGIAAAQDLVKEASAHLNSQLTHYGLTQQRLAEGIRRAADAEIRDKAEISNLAEADLAAAATEMTQARLHEEAAMAAQAGYRRPNLFSYLR
jgi:flagellar hook-associated protein 3 FlgL